MTQRIKDQLCHLGLHQYENVGVFPFRIAANEKMLLKVLKCTNCNFKKYLKYEHRNS